MIKTKGRVEADHVKRNREEKQLLNSKKKTLDIRRRNPRENDSQQEILLLIKFLVKR